MISLNATQEPTGKLSPEPWLSEPATIAVMDALTAGGADVRYVGGCVRDALARRPVHDIDIGTPDTPVRVGELLRAKGIKVIPTGIEHGTVTAVVSGHAFEITTLRCDIETDGRRAVVAYTDDWIVDSSRRDLTINAMSATRDGDVYDYHDGIPDLAHGRIRFIGRAEERVAEDYLRILRYFRFYGHFGRPPYDEGAFNACRRNAEKLLDISAERIRYELLRILIAPDPADVFILMRDAHVLSVILPEATEIGQLRAAAWLATRGVIIDGLRPDSLRHLAATLQPGSDTAALAGRLRLSNRETERLQRMVSLAPAFAEPLGVEQTRRLAHAHGADAVADAAILAWASRLADVAKLPAAETAARLKELETVFAWTPPVFPVGGSDAQALGLERGPAVGDALRAVEDWWAEADFKADRAECLQKLQSVVRQIKGGDTKEDHE